MDQRDVDDLKYLRPGHIDLGRLCDRLAKVAAFLLEGSILPPRWLMDSTFVEKHGMGPFWAKTQSYHMFIFNGHPLFRIWTNTAAEYAWVDVEDQLASMLDSYLKVEDIPPGNLKKCKPLSKRLKASSTDDITLVTTMVQEIWLG